jgi:hypothetical protein
MKKYLFELFALLIVSTGCKVAYQPPVTTASSNYLVVEGTVNSNNGNTDSTFFKLSRTVAIGSVTSNPELHAQITIEDGQNYSFILKDLGKGTYAAGPLGINNTKKYRVRIKTSDGKVYLSDLESVSYTPPIDSIGFTVLQNGIQLYVNTHNSNDNTRYYRWDFAEDWKFRTAYDSQLITNGSRIVTRTPDQDVNICWGHDVSTGVILGSSAKLTHDVIYQAPITPIASTSEKIEERYCIQLKQYALTAGAFAFWDQLRKNTENLGSIFDAQPSQISGNIHCVTNPAEQVFGYISITNVQSKRVYINKSTSNIPASFQPDAWTKCVLPDTVLDAMPPNGPSYLITGTDLLPTGSAYIPVSENMFVITGPFPPTNIFKTHGYLAEPASCVDCTTRGVTKKPAFWVDQ